MFAIDIARVAEQCEQLTKQVQVLRSCAWELEEAISALKTLSCLDEQIKRLHDCSLDMEELYYKFQRFVITLERIGETYHRCELRVLDQGEQAVVVYKPDPTGVVNTAGIQQILSELTETK